MFLAIQYCDLCSQVCIKSWKNHGADILQNVEQKGGKKTFRVVSRP